MIDDIRSIISSYLIMLAMKIHKETFLVIISDVLRQVSEHTPTNYNEHTHSGEK